MGEKTGILWTSATWNPWQGCHRVSEGCRFCYMYREKKRYGQDPTTVVRSKPPTFNAPLKWKEPALVFACSWSDFFIDEADAWRPEAWDIIRRTPHLTYQIPTKRPERIAACLPPDWGSGYPNVWLLASVESQRAADARVAALLRVPAVVHGLSMEPLLSGVNLARVEAGNGFLLDALTGRMMDDRGATVIRPGIGGFARLSWVIVGGESGPFARPMHPDWARAIRNQCETARVPFFFKQWGEWRPEPKPQTAFRRRVDAGTVVELKASRPGAPAFIVAIPSDAYDNPGPVELLERVGVKAAGRELDGQVWDQMPPAPPPAPETNPSKDGE